MVWTIKFTKKAKKEFLKLDKNTQKQIDKLLTKLSVINPRSIGKCLAGNLKPFWRYRVGDYRLICSIEGGVLTVLVISVKHRKNIYKSNG